VDGKAGPYQFITFSEAGKQSVQIASACAALGLKRSDRVGVLGLNSPEWMLAMQVRSLWL
jgi:long-chain acyl-CoA synthetase